MGKVKYKYIIALFLIGMAGRIFGTLAKVTHAPNANLLLTIFSLIMMGSIITAVIKIIATKDTNSILNQ